MNADACTLHPCFSKSTSSLALGPPAQGIDPKTNRRAADVNGFRRAAPIATLHGTEKVRILVAATGRRNPHRGKDGKEVRVPPTLVSGVCVVVLCERFIDRGLGGVIWTSRQKGAVMWCCSGNGWR